MRDLEDPVTWGQYVTLRDLWSRTLQNGQSEFFAMAAWSPSRSTCASAALLSPARRDPPHCDRRRRLSTHPRRRSATAVHDAISIPLRR
ncbi:DUF6766 family protein [Oerskovia sp. Root22]|uniref:DUF6766 family protein n=1 Tax=Oerskovia sp. Root22 TaxID=1736494 RepID=UPI00350FD988